MFTLKKPSTKKHEVGATSIHSNSSALTKAALLTVVLVVAAIVAFGSHTPNSATHHALFKSEPASASRVISSNPLGVDPDMSDWVLISRQVAGSWFPESTKTTGLLNENNPSGPAYCILARLENYRRNGKFHFRLRWPSLNREQEWKQSVNPWTDRAPQSFPVPGYEPVRNAPAINVYWKGLEWQGTAYALLTGNRGVPYFAVGAFTGINIQGQRSNTILTFGGPSRMFVNEAELYVYAPAPTTTTQPPITTQAPPQPPQLPCLPCRVMMKDLCDASPKCNYTDYCRCRNLQTDFVFLVDASGSVGSQGFDFEKQVVDTIIGNLPADSRVGVIRFGNAATAVVKLFSGGSINAVRGSVMNMVYQPNELTHMGEAVQMALGPDYLSNPQATRSRTRIVLLTDGVPNGGIDPCDASLVAQIHAKNGLEVIVIGVTNQFSAASVSCLVSDPQQYIVEAKDLTLNSFALVWGRIDDLICPEPPVAIAR